MSYPLFPTSAGLKPQQTLGIELFVFSVTNVSHRINQFRKNLKELQKLCSSKSMQTYKTFWYLSPHGTKLNGSSVDVTQRFHPTALCESKLKSKSSSCCQGLKIVLCNDLYCGFGVRSYCPMNYKHIIFKHLSWQIIQQYSGKLNQGHYCNFHTFLFCVHWLHWLVSIKVLNEMSMNK